MKHDTRYAEAMGRVGGAFGPGRANGAGPYKVGPLPPVAEPAPVSPADPDAILLGETEYGAPLTINLVKLVGGRLLVQGISDAGKSWLLRRLLEQTAGRVQQIVIDPEGEFDTLAEELGHLYVDARKLDGPSLAKLATRVRQQRLSVVLDFSEWGAEGKMEALTAFIGPLIECAEEFWTTAMVAIDEAHLFAPYGGQDLAAASTRKASIGAVVDLMSRGRKRGLVGVLATQRLARLSKSVASEVHNFLIGKNTLDLDIKRASETIGWSARKGSDRLPLLDAGNFIAVGSAFSQSPVVAKIGGVRSRHKGRTPTITAPASATPEEARAALGIDELVGESFVAPDPEEDADAPPPIAEARPAGVRSKVCWLPTEDEILVSGYSTGLLLRDISANLEAAGFRPRTAGAISMRAKALGKRGVRSHHQWEPAEDEIVIEGYRAEQRLVDIVARLAAAGFERQRPALQMRAITLGLTDPDRQQRFAEREKEIVRDALAAGKTRSEALALLRAEGFNRSINSISKIAQRFGYHEKRNLWSEQDLAILAERIAANAGSRAIAAELGRTVSTINTKAHQLGLRRRHEWGDDQKRRLADASRDGTRLIDIATELGQPYANVAAMAKRMGLSFSPVARRGITA